jgi:L-amino acid N-acyltransferase YncA
MTSVVGPGRPFQVVVTQPSRERRFQTLESRRRRLPFPDVGRTPLRTMGIMEARTDVATTVVRPMRDEDWPGVRAIYVEGIATGNATFETEAPSFERWSATHLPEHRLVAVRGEDLVGWAALAPLSDRCVYAGVAENSVYVAERGRGQRVGRRLLEALIAHADAAGIWTIQSGIFPENVASVQLHVRCGFRVVGTRERLGQLHGRWRDVLMVERRKP